MTHKSKNNVERFEEAADEIEDAALDLTTSIDEGNLVEAKAVAMKILILTLAFHLRLAKELPSLDFETVVLDAAKKLTQPKRAKAIAA